MPEIGISFKPDAKAVSRFESRRAKPSAMSSSEWERIASAVREKCFFSARVNNAEVLGKMRDLLGQAIDSNRRDSSKAMLSQDKFISEMKDFLRGNGYAMGGSKLTDITSRRRLGLIYQMNVDEAREYGRYVRGQDTDLLYEFPAQEFLRIEDRRVPRTNWQARWRAAGGKIYGGRMIALKSSEVWTNLSRFGRPYPPFDYGSGMGVEDIDRDEAIKLGLIPDDEPADEIPDFDVAMEAEVSLERIPADLRGQFIKDTPNAEIRGDKLLMRDKPKLPTWQDAGLESTRSWKSSTPKIKETLVDVDTAKKRLQDGFSVEAPIGLNVKFSGEVLTHWEEALKLADDVFGRLKRINVAEDCIRNALEVWELPNGQLMFIGTFETTHGKIKGIAVAVSKATVVRTWFTSKIQELDKCRKGKLVYKH